MMYLFFFFKQKEAYEMRISDWSSDVCSSDLGRDVPCDGTTTHLYPNPLEGVDVYNNIVENTGADGIQLGSATEDVMVYNNRVVNYGTAQETSHSSEIGRASGRERACQDG